MSVKLILRTNKPKKDGTLPLALQITKDRKSSVIHLGHSIKETDWDPVNQRVKKSHPNSVRLNNLILKKLAEANDTAIDLETNKQFVTAKTVKQKIRPKAEDTFFPQAAVYIQTLKVGGKYNQYTADKSRIKHFKEFLGHDIAFADITVGTLEQFKAYLKGSKKLSERSAINCLSMVRSVFASARKHEVIDDRISPFGKGKMVIKFPDSKKVGLTREEIKRLEELKMPQPYNQSVNYFLFCYYTGGSRISDVMRLKWDDIQDGRLNYVMNKNDKGDSIKLPAGALRILAQYEREPGELIFPDLKGIDLQDEFKVQRQIAFATSRHDKYLRKHVAPAAKIEKNITMHKARHSFAQNATDIDVRVLQKIFRHNKLDTTIGYMGNFKTELMDDAFDRVLNPS